MKRLLKILLSLLLGIISLLLIAILIIVFVIDLNNYKPQITELVEDTIGRTLTIDGDIGLTFYPWIGLNLGKVSLGNAAGFEEPEFAKIKQAQVLIKLIPLFKKQVQVDTVLLEGAEITLTRKSDGTTNWDDLAALGGEQQAPKEDVAPFKDFQIDGIDLRHAKIVWDDQQTASHYILSEVNLNTSAINLNLATLSLNEPVKLQLNTRLNISGDTTLSGQIGLDTQISLNQEQQHYRLEPLQINATVQGNSIPGGTQTLSITTQAIDINLIQQSLTLDGLVTKLMAGVLSGDIQATHLQTNPTLSGTLKLADLNLPNLLKQLQLPAALPNDKLLKTVGGQTQFQANMAGIRLTNLHLSADDNQLKVPLIYLDLNQQTLQSDALTLQAFGVHLNGQVQIKQLFNQPTVDGQLTLAPFNPRQLHKRLEQAKLLPPQTLPDEKLLPLKTAALQTQFHVNKATLVSLKNFNLRLDDNKLQLPLLQLDLDKQTLNTNTLILQALDIRLNGQVHIEQLFNQPTVDGQLTLAPFNPRQLLKRLEPAKLFSPQLLPDPKLLPLNTAKLQTQFKINQGTNIILKQIDLRLDDNQFQTPQLTLDLNRQTLDLATFSLHALGIRLNGKLTAKQILSNATAQAELTAALNPQQLLQRLGQSPLELPAPLTLTRATLQTKINLTPNNLTLKGLHITVDDKNQLHSQHINFNITKDTLTTNNFMLKVLDVATLNGTLHAQHLTTRPTLQSTLKITAFSPRRLLQRLGQPIETSDPSALNTLALETQLQGSLSQLNLKPLKIRLDNSQLQGQLRILDLQQQVLAFNLNLDQIDLDRYLPPKPAEAPQASQPNSPPLSGGDILLPLEMLRALNLNGSLKVGKLKAAGITINDIQLDVSAKQGKMKVTPKASLDNGTSQSPLALNEQNHPPRVNLNRAHLNSVQVNPLPKDLYRQTELSSLPLIAQNGLLYNDDE